MEDLLGQEKTFKDDFGSERSPQRSHVTSLAGGFFVEGRPAWKDQMHRQVFLDRCKLQCPFLLLNVPGRTQGSARQELFQLR